MTRMRNTRSIALGAVLVSLIPVAAGAQREALKGWVGVAYTTSGETDRGGRLVFDDYPVIESVEPSSPAQKAGLAAGDTILGNELAGSSPQSAADGVDDSTWTEDCLPLQAKRFRARGYAYSRTSAQWYVGASGTYADRAGSCGGCGEKRGTRASRSAIDGAGPWRT